VIEPPQHRHKPKLIRQRADKRKRMRYLERLNFSLKHGCPAIFAVFDLMNGKADGRMEKSHQAMAESSQKWPNKEDS
jgi:hypothetical protein